MRRTSFPVRRSIGHRPQFHLVSSFLFQISIRSRAESYPSISMDSTLSVANSISLFDYSWTTIRCDELHMPLDIDLRSSCHPRSPSNINQISNWYYPSTSGDSGPYIRNQLRSFNHSLNTFCWDELHFPFEEPSGIALRSISSPPFSLKYQSDLESELIHRHL
jgi:hypothetical protein